MFDKEFFRISKNLKDGNIVDYDFEFFFVVYVNLNDVKIGGFV